MSEDAGIDQHVIRSLQDWRFFFHHAKAAMGVKAIDYEAWSVSAHEPSRGNPPSQRRLDAAGDHAKIERRLLLMPAVAVRIIRLTCEEPPRELWEPFHTQGLGNIADQSICARRAYALSRSSREFVSWLDRLGSRLLRGRGTPEDRVLKERIGKDIERIVVDVHKDYQQARGRAG